MSSRKETFKQRKSPSFVFLFLPLSVFNRYLWMNMVVFQGKLMLGFQRINLFHVMLRNCQFKCIASWIIHDCVCLAESINKCVEGKFYIYQKKVLETSGCGNHVWAAFDHHYLSRKLVVLKLVKFQFHCTIVVVRVKSIVNSLSCLRTVV